MNNWRVVKERHGADMYDPGYDLFSIRDVSGAFNSPFVTHVPPHPHGSDIDELRQVLHSMLSALDKPTLEWTRPVLRESVSSAETT